MFVLSVTPSCATAVPSSQLARRTTAGSRPRVPLLLMADGLPPGAWPGRCGCGMPPPWPLRAARCCPTRKEALREGRCHDSEQRLLWWLAASAQVGFRLNWEFIPSMGPPLPKQS